MWDKIYPQKTVESNPFICYNYLGEESKPFPLKSNTATIKIMLKNGGEIIGEFKHEKDIIRIPVGSELDKNMVKGEIIAWSDQS